MVICNSMKIPAKIAAIQQETPSVKSFRLDLEGQQFSFLPGQWVDCYAEVNGRLEVAGYSMTSSPLTRGTIDLAVKLVGDNAVTNFLHQRARVGDTLYIEGGQGDFYYQREMGDSLVLIGGGIGITPLMSILRYVDEATSDVRATLLYSARTPSELLFHKQLMEVAARNRRIRCLFTVTQPGGERWRGRVGRIDEEMLKESQLDLNAIFYVCGPPPMIKDMAALLSGLEVNNSLIKYEQWW
jgi:ferredoxin-NADP reductase